MRGLVGSAVLLGLLMGCNEPESQRQTEASAAPAESARDSSMLTLSASDAV